MRLVGVYANLAATPTSVRVVYEVSPRLYVVVKRIAGVCRSVKLWSTVDESFDEVLRHWRTQDVITDSFSFIQMKESRDFASTMCRSFLDAMVRNT